MQREVRLLIDYEVAGEINDTKEIDRLFLDEIISSIPGIIYIDEDCDLIINSIEEIEED